VGILVDTNILDGGGRSLDDVAQPARGDAAEPDRGAAVGPDGLRIARMLTGLLEGAHMLAPDDLPGLVRQQAAVGGFDDAVMYLADLQQDVLVPLPIGDGAQPPSTVVIEGSLAGKAFWSEQIIDTPIDARSDGDDGADGHRLWVPIVDGTERLGVLRLSVEQVNHEIRAAAQHLTSLVALLLVSKRPFSDTTAMLTRTRPMTLAAEMQWALLPPLTFATGAVVVSAATEPAYEVGGDAFDYATAGSTLFLAIFDAMGHDLDAGLAASLALGAWRSARRRGQALDEASHTVEAAIRTTFGRRRYVTGVLAALDTATGTLRWVARGHPQPLIIRGGKLVRSPGCHTAPMMGMGLTAKPEICTAHLEPGDRLLLYTDGITDAHRPGGEVFGLERFIDFITRHHADGLSTPETLRRLIHAVLAYHHGQLRDDASVLIAQWRPANPVRAAGVPTG
jgi:serine phosphatase RsbU (regulator of sigma subunit)